VAVVGKLVVRLVSWASASSEPGTRRAPPALVCEGAAVDDFRLGAANLIAFVGASVGPAGTTVAIRGGQAVAGPMPIAHAFLNAAVATEPTADPVAFLDDAAAFFADRARGHVVWAADGQPGLVAEAARRGGVVDLEPPPAMAIHDPIPAPVGAAAELVVSVVDGGDDDARARFGELCERGYGIPGLAWLLTEQDSYRAPGTTWAVVEDGDTPVGVACGYRDGDAGGIYYVATPPEHRGRGAAAVATTWLTNRLLADGAATVVLQASTMGRPVYGRLGFRTYDTYQRFTFPEPATP
jgi:hypothetical protein